MERTPLKIAMTRQILVTSALPYANGPIHIGHLVEYIQTDIWVRFQKLRGHRCIYVCADDTHGTAIMIRARKEGRSEEEVIAAMSAAHQRDFAGFGIEFDNYGSTHSDANRALCGTFWKALREADLVTERAIEQLYDPEAETFLADRFVRGTCPKCGRTDQAGDNCTCGHTYSPTDLIDPKSTLSGATPVLRESTHLFVELEKLHDFLIDWVESAALCRPKLPTTSKGIFWASRYETGTSVGLRPILASRSPTHPATIGTFGLMPRSATSPARSSGARLTASLDDWWKNEDCEIHHFIGKDITYFHTLFWPGMFKTAGYSLPTKVHIHGFLTVDGEKMSKSKGTFVSAETYLKHSHPTYLRYFYATKLTRPRRGPRPGIDEFTKSEYRPGGQGGQSCQSVGKFAQSTGLSNKYPDDGGLFQAAATAETRSPRPTNPATTPMRCG